MIRSVRHCRARDRLQPPGISQVGKMPGAIRAEPGLPSQISVAGKRPGRLLPGVYCSLSGCLACNELAQAARNRSLS